MTFFSNFTLFPRKLENNWKNIKNFKIDIGYMQMLIRFRANTKYPILNKFYRLQGSILSFKNPKFILLWNTYFALHLHGREYIII